MDTYTFHITPYDLVLLGTVFIGFSLALQLAIANRMSRGANRFLSLALAVMVCWQLSMLAKNMGLEAWFPHWNRLPLLFSLALGPLLFFYVRKTSLPQQPFRFKDWLHFTPLLLQIAAHLLAVEESISTGAAIDQTLIFSQLNFVIQLLAFISVGIYLYAGFKLIEQFYNSQQFNGGDRHRYQLRWLRNLIIVFSLIWIGWIPVTAVDYFYYHHQLGMQAYYSWYVVLSVMGIAMAMLAFLRPEISETAAAPLFLKPATPAEWKDKGTWLKKTVKTNGYYRDPGLSLVSLAEKLGLTTHELSRIINVVLKKSFNDLINEFRVADVIRKMQDPAYHHITLLGIAFESGFNSKSTFNRTFKQISGKSPLAYKNDIQKGFPSYNLGRTPRFAALISYQETAPNGYDGLLNRMYMFKNYLKSAWRHIKRHKTYSAINVMGLALGICGCLVIYLVARFEFSFDTFHPDEDRIYCVDISGPNPRNGGRDHMNAVPAPMPEAMRNDLSGLEKIAAFQPFRPKVKIKDGEKVSRHFDETEAIIAQPDYLDILPYTWLSGSKKTALTDPLTVVLTLSRAKTYFGDLPPSRMIGKTIIYNDSLMVRVTGILQDWNKNTDFNFSDFISYSTIAGSFLKYQFPQDKWDIMTGAQVLVKLPLVVKPSQIDAQFPAFVKKYFGGTNPGSQIQLQPFTGIHFHQEYGGPGNKADLRVLYILSMVAIFILFIAAINFINLSTAQSIQRTKDIGILKVLGSGRGGILFQFLTETFILALLAVAIAVIAVQPLLGLFAAYIPPGVKFHFTDLTTWLFLAGIVIFTTVLAGVYPARLLSAFKPVASLKGETSKRSGNKGYLRKSLIVFQFTISLLFIIGTIAISNQVSYMQNKDLGIKTSNIITLRMVFSNHPGKMKVLAEQLKQLPGIEQVITEGVPPVGRGHMGDPIRTHGPLQWSMDSYTYPGDEHFVPFYHMKIIAGRNLLHSDSATEYLVNETAAKALGFRDPRDAVGKLMLWGPRNKGYPIVGVVGDFYETSFYNKIQPCVILNYAERQMSIALKLTPAEYQKGDMPLLINRIAKEWKKVYPEEPFDYAFLGDSIAKLYESEQQTQWLMRTATVITIFISCMGLFGLAMFTTERRTKEISIRKVMGASVTHILTMLNKEVAVLIAISLVIASPIAWYFIYKWLQNFAYHTSLSFWVFILAGAGALLIALATISFRTVRSATANPVEGLRNE